MPTFDREIAKLAERLLIRGRPIDYRTGVFASEVTPGIPGVKPVTIKMIDAKTKYVFDIRHDRSLFFDSQLHLGHGIHPFHFIENTWKHSK
jgi:hypothetical protein